MPWHCNRGVAAVGISTVLLQTWHWHHGHRGVTKASLPQALQLWHCHHAVTALGIAAPPGGQQHCRHCSRGDLGCGHRRRPTAAVGTASTVSIVTIVTAASPVWARR